MKEGSMSSTTRNPGRVAGVWYLLLVLLGPVRLIYIPTKLFVRGNATATASNLAAHEWLFRFGIVSDLFCGVILIFLVLAFYRLFQGVDRNLAVQVVILGGVMPALLDFVGVVYDAAALMAVRGGDFLAPFDKPQRDALALMFLKLRDHQNTAAEMLWGAWLLPLALLVYRSRFLPRFLGVWLAFGGVAYFVRTPFGIALQGIRDNPRRMRALGFDVTLHRVAAHALAGFVAAVGGVLWVWYNGRISPGTIGTGAMINVLIVAVLGGLRQPLGAFLGALVFVLLQNFAIDLVDRERFNLVIGGVFLAVVLFSPDGLLGLWQRLRAVPLWRRP